MENKVIVIPRIEPVLKDEATGLIRKKRVAAYARVSTDEEDQKSSFRAQEWEYTHRIKENPEWEFVGLYADEGITGTDMGKREGFLKMIRDAKAGLIDLILVKSISRFARNTVDCIRTKRELQEIGVEIFFEKENISSLDDKSETMIAIFASLAQEESRQISGNVIWGVRKRMKAGIYCGNGRLFGYKQLPEGKLEIIPEQAEVVRLIYGLFLIGYSYRDIIAELYRREAKNIKGEVNWGIGVIMRTLSNEKYCGDMIYQKTFIKSYLTHRSVKNEGQLEKYYIQNHHEPIIPREEFEYAQKIRRQRANEYEERKNHNITPISGLIICGCCGRVMKKIQYCKGKSYERFVLTCKNTKKASENYSVCDCLPIDYELVIKALEETLKDRLEELNANLIIESIAESKTMLEFYKEQEAIEKETAELNEKINTLVQNQINKALSIKYYNEEFKVLKDKLKELKDRKEALELKTINEAKLRKVREDLTGYLQKNERLTLDLVSLYVKKIVRNKDNSIFILLGDKEIADSKVEAALKDEKKIAKLSEHIISDGKHNLVYKVFDLEVEYAIH